MNLKSLESDYQHFLFENGFSLVSDDVGFSPNFCNADFVNKQKEIVIELKIIDKDFFGNGGFIDSLSMMVAIPKSVNTDGTGFYEFMFPETNRKGTLDNLSEPLRRIIKKGNKQIKETKQYYSYVNKGYGFLVIIQIGLQLFPIVDIARVFKNIINKEFSHVDGVIILKPNQNFMTSTSFLKESDCVSITKETNLYKKQICIELADKCVKYFEAI